METFRRDLGKLVDLIYPRRLYCLCCGDMIDSSREIGFCDSCIEKIMQNDIESFDFESGSFSFDDILCCCRYGESTRNLIYNFKQNGHTYYAESLGRLMGERALRSEKKDGVLYDCIIPVPCTKEKRRLRGFNQTELLGLYVSKTMFLPLYSDVLIKIRETKAAKSSDSAARRMMQRGAFSVENSEKIKGKHVLLLDDVITTGSTAGECAFCLKKSGAISVTVLCFAGLEKPLVV